MVAKSLDNFFKSGQPKQSKGKPASARPKKEKVKNDSPENGEKKSRGPPNRINDLDYSTWMKFQKSFFLDEPDQLVIEKAIYFFTKAKWESGAPSRIFIGGFDTFDQTSIPLPREIITNANAVDLLDTDKWDQILWKGQFDFIFLNLVPFLPSFDEIDNFLNNKLPMLLKNIKRSLNAARYACLLTCPVGNPSRPFPLPWFISEAIRPQLRLRDEKLRLFTDSGAVQYLLHVQNIPEERVTHSTQSCNIMQSSSEMIVPAWIIPRPPPRTPGEILHPAKFPETLIDTFIDLFTQKGEWVFDPMAGTGSSIISAMGRKRNGVGVELNPKFAQSAMKRIQNSFPRPLFKEFYDKMPQGKVIQGNALELSKIPEIADFRAKYCVTSPPYWSMLQNKGSEYQRSRRVSQLQTTYSDDTSDLGNEPDYNSFVNKLVSIYNFIGDHVLAQNGVLTVIVKYVKREHLIYGLPWDLTFHLCHKDSGRFTYLGTTFWCQDDINLKPFAVGAHWVSNTLHQYCLHFQKLN